MARFENIERYMRAQFAAERTPDGAPAEFPTRPFVTISRETGTGGHALAETMLDVFDRQADTELFGGWQVFDRTLCEIVARDPRFARSLESLLEEQYRSRTNDFVYQMLRSTADQTAVMNRVFLVVRTVAGMGKTIIVGRAGSHVTFGMDQGVRLRLVAPFDCRIARAMDVHDLTEKEAKAGARTRDTDRARMMKSRFGVDIADPAGYDVTWNSGSTSFEEIAEAVATLVRGRA